MPLDEDGREILDSTPIVIRVRRREISQFEDVRAFIRREMSDAAAREGAETFEESLDFEVDDDPMPPSRWEYSADQEAEDRETIVKQAEREAKARETSEGGTGGAAPKSRSVDRKAVEPSGSGRQRRADPPDADEQDDGD